MATDNSPPRNKIIFIGAVVTVTILVMLKFAFDSYFIMMMEGEAAAKIAEPAELRGLHADEQKKLTQGPLPIAKAIGELGKGRDGNPLIAPQPSPDDGPMIGWSKGTRALAASADGGAATQPAMPGHDALTQPADGGVQHAGDSDSGVAVDGGKKHEPHIRTLDNQPTIPAPGAPAPGSQTRD